MTYSIGDCHVILEEISAIGALHKSGSNYSHLDIYLKGGQKIVATITADEQDTVGSTHISSGGFIKKTEKIINLFVESWRLANKDA